MRTLGIDLGSRRVGLALSDEGGRFATPYDVLQVTSEAAAIEPILQVIKKEGVERLVVGLPLNMDDSVGPAARNVVAWSKELSEKSGIPHLLVDERLSSFDAEQGIIDRKRGGEKITRKQKKGQLDALSAQGFLQSFLDGKLSPIDVDR